MNKTEILKLIKEEVRKALKEQNDFDRRWDYEIKVNEWDQGDRWYHLSHKQFTKKFKLNGTFHGTVYADNELDAKQKAMDQVSDNTGWLFSDADVMVW